MSEQRCECCGSRLVFQWSDTHGVGVCCICGLPYRIYHYEDDKRIEKAPEVAVKADWLAIGKAYWNETKRRVFPASYDMGISGRTGRSYSGASENDCYEFDKWLETHPELLPKQESTAEAPKGDAE